jgi:hypothetical protein
MVDLNQFLKCPKKIRANKKRTLIKQKLQRQGFHYSVSGLLSDREGVSSRLYIAVTKPAKNPISPVANGSTSLVASGLGTNIETTIRKVPAATVKVTIFPNVVNPWCQVLSHQCFGLFLSLSSLLGIISIIESFYIYQLLNILLNNSLEKGNLVCIRLAQFLHQQIVLYR